MKFNFYSSYDPSGVYDEPSGIHSDILAAAINAMVFNIVTLNK